MWGGFKDEGWGWGGWWGVGVGGLHSSSDGFQPTSDDTRSEAITLPRSEAIVFLRSEATTSPCPCGKNRQVGRHQISSNIYTNWVFVPLIANQSKVKGDLLPKVP